MLGLISLPVERSHLSDLALAVWEDRQPGDLVVKAVRLHGDALPQLELIRRSCLVFVPGAGLLERHVVQTDSGEVLGVRYAWPRS
jgi:hypothetical protein